VYASRTRKEQFSGHDENCHQNASDLEGSLVTSSRPPEGEGKGNKTRLNLGSVMGGNGIEKDIPSHLHTIPDPIIPHDSQVLTYLPNHM